MSLLDRLAEAHIQKAIENGEMEHLPGKGKPLLLDDDSMIPAELRAGYRLLKNSGFLPPELELAREIREVESLILRMDHGEEREEACVRLGLLRTRLQQRGHDLSPLLQRGDYHDKLIQQWDQKNR
ncbi:DnaJ family domain-containing protein [Halomonas sp. M20]|uniref:DnaJ family domain-containing protein n=1 Tax=Halomonas sp. M20 TaxID=2763264 RepID=UPI001D0AB9ED|nr:DnaJ family domain-containing protein [Halomonas sp. M20]